MSLSKQPTNFQPLEQDESENQHILSDRHKNNQSFSHHMLNRDPTSLFGSPNQYYHEVAYKVDLKSMATCYYNLSHDYIPVFMQLGVQEMEVENNGHKYVIQIWNKSKAIHCQFPLECPIKRWQSGKNHCLFQKVNENNTLYVVDYDTKRLIKLTGLLLPNSKELFMSIQKKFLILAGHDQLYIYPIQNLFRGKASQVDCSKLRSQITKIDEPQIRILGLFNMDSNDEGYPGEDQTYLIFENQQGKADFYLMELNENQANNQNGGEYLIRLRQAAEVTQRKYQQGEYAKIKKICYKVVDNILYAVTVNKSDQADLYANMNHIQQIDKNVVDAEMSMLSIFLEMKETLETDKDIVLDVEADKEEGETSVKYDKLRHCYIRFDKVENVNYESKKIILDDKFNLSVVKDKIIQDYVDIFQSFLIDTSEKGTICLVAHGRFISAFDLTKNMFLAKHLVLPCEIDILFHIDKRESSYKEKTLGVLLKNSDIFYNLREKFFPENEESSQRDITLIKIDKANKEEWDSFEMKDYIGTLYFSDQEIDKRNWLLVYNENQIDILYKQDIIKGEYETKKKITSLAKYYEFGQKTENKNHMFVINEEGKHTLNILKDVNLYSMTEKFIQKRKSLFITQKKEESHQKSNHIVHLHSYPNKYISLNYDTISVHDLQETENSEEFPGFMVASFLIINENVNYALCREFQGSRVHGLVLIDFNKILREQAISVTKLNDNDVALDPQLSQFESLERIGFMSSVNEFVLVPYLHQDRIVLMGYQEIFEKEGNKILLEIQYREEYSIFCTDQYVYNWTLHDGKLQSANKKEFLFNFNDYLIEPIVQNGIVLMKSNQDLIYGSYSILEEVVNQYLPSYQQISLKIQSVSKIRQQVMGMRKWIAIKFSSSLDLEHIEFEFPLFQKSKIFLTSNLDKLLVLLQDKAIIYNKDEIEQDSIKKVVWKPQRTIQDYPFHLDYTSEITSHPHVVSPDFRYYLKYDSAKQIFTINSLLDGELVTEIDPYILRAESIQESKIEAFRFTWVEKEEEMFKVMHSMGTEVVYQFNKEQGLKIHRYNVWPLFEEEFIQDMLKSEGEPFYAQLESAFNQDDEQIQNLKLKYQLYKSDFYLKKYEDCMMFKMIHKKSFKDCYVQQSFTYLHWALVYDIKYQYIQVEDLTDRILEGIIYNIFPGGKTFLHLLAYDPKSAITVFERCHDEETGIKFHVPYLPNFENHSFFTKAIQKDLKKLNQRTAMSVLKFLKHYGIDHHSRCMMEFYKDIISSKSQVALDYLESRMVQTNELKDLDYGCLKGIDRIISAPKLHPEQYDAFEPVEGLELKSIKIEILDLPAVYHYQDPNFEEIFRVLSKHDNRELFSNKSIQTLIDLNYDIARGSTFVKLIIPFAIFHTLYVCYTNILYEYRNGEDESYKKANIGICIILFAFSIYFLSTEFGKIWSLRTDYFTLFWNYVDLLAPCLVIIQISYYFAELSNGEEVNFTANRVFLSLATLLMWAKFLSIFRMFDATNYLIRTIIEVIYDMGIFLLVLLITVVGFGDSFLRLSLGNEEESQFIKNFPDSILFAYSMILGGYDTEAFGEVGVSLVQILWIACTIIDMIVMLNLLIAIISASFEKITDNQIAATYQEKARIISENRLLIPTIVKQKYAAKDLYIVQAKDVDKENELCDEEEKRFKDLNDLCLGIKKTTNENIKAILDHQKEKDIKQEEAIKQMIRRIGEVKISVFDIAKLQQEEITILQHRTKLKRVILYEVQQRYPDDYKFWKCQAKKFRGCCQEDKKDDQSRNRTNLNEIVYHCDALGLDFCTDCFEIYEDRYQHPLKKFTLSELIKQDERYKEGWGCDGNNIFIQCKRPLQQDNGDIYEEFYKSENEQFDFCCECVTHFRMIEADIIESMKEDKEEQKIGLQSSSKNGHEVDDNEGEEEDQESSEYK